jgi:protein-disulfide isomerase
MPEYTIASRYTVNLYEKRSFFMSRNILIVLLVLSFCFLGFSVGRYTYVPAVGPDISIAKEAPDLADLPDVQKALTMAIIASSADLAKSMAKNLDSQNLTKDAIATFRKAASGLKGAGGKQRNQPDPNKIYELTEDDAPTLGPKDAPVTIVAFSEFQCPFCGRAQKTMEELKKDYGDKVRFVFRSKLLPNHAKAPLAHAAAYAAGRQDKFWEMHDLIFTDQRNLTEEAFKKYASQIGLNMAKFEKDLKDPNIAKEWADDEKEANRLGVRSTPTFFVNGKMVRGAKPKAEFVKVIDEMLAKSKK